MCNDLRTQILIEKDDDVVDFRYTKELFRGKKNVKIVEQAKGGHHSHIIESENTLEVIKKFTNQINENK